MRLVFLLLLLCGLSAQAQEKAASPNVGSPKEASPNVAASKEVADEDVEIKEILDSMGYPELQVVPRASERLRMESRIEKSSWWAAHWPVQVSGLATMAVGFSASGNRKEGLSANEKSDANTIATLSQVVGGAWVASGLILGGQHPYNSALKQVNKINGKDDRSQLLRERLAEEALERPARIMRVLQHISVLTNASLNGLTLAYSNDKGKVMSGVGIVLAFLPYMFEDPSISVFNKHIEYKKKIYAPLKSAGLHIDPVTHAVTPITQLVWMF